jgi:hypothetical protein
MRTRLALCTLILLLGACAEPKPAKPNGGFVEGQARVISVDETLGQAILDIEGYRVCAYWQTEVALGQGYNTIAAGPLKPDIVQYQTPVIKKVKFPAKPGDNVHYSGMQTGAELYLRGVEVLAH